MIHFVIYLAFSYVLFACINDSINTVLLKANDLLVDTIDCTYFHMTTNKFFEM